MVEFAADNPLIDDSNNITEDSNSGPFEGPEKLLEIWFAPTPPKVSDDDGVHDVVGARNGLRTVPRTVWEDMLDIVKCKVLSVVVGREVDAYLLRSVQPKSLLDLFFPLLHGLSIYALRLFPSLGVRYIRPSFNIRMKLFVSPCLTSFVFNPANHHSLFSHINSFSKHAGLL